VEATVTGPNGPVAGETVSFASSDPAEQIGSVTDNGDGTYSAKVTGSKKIESATITATDSSASPSVSGTASLAQVAPTVTVSLSPSTITADGRSHVTATATVTAGGASVSGDGVAFQSSDGGEKIGPATDNGNGTYTALITASTKVEQATITATDSSASPSVTGTATLTQLAPTTVKVTLSPTTITAGGRAQTLATATVVRGGAAAKTDSIAFSSSDPNELIGPVTNLGNGKYTAKITASEKVETATITATDTTPYPTVSAAAALKQVAPTISLALKPASILANGSAQSVATAIVTGGGKPVLSDAIVFTSSDPGEVIGPVTNLGNGKYTATITASHTIETATIKATDTSVNPHPSKTATLKQT
jgi:adhesin/invasin